MRANDLTLGFGLVFVSLFFLGYPAVSLAHCDGMDGPVVKAAQKALESGSANLILLWVQKKDESEVKEAFQKTLAVRKLGAEARELADHYFFETLVRIHRAGEGAPYAGLKPAGRDLGPAIPAADRAIDDGSVKPLLRLLTASLQVGVREQFKKVMANKRFDRDNVEAGRAYVKAYVEYIHYVERLYEAAEPQTEGHFSEPGAHASEGGRSVSLKHGH